MVIKKPFYILAVLFLVLAASSAALACACCVERGFYSLENSRPESFHIAMLESMNFGPGELYMTVAGFDGIKGLSMLEKDEAAGKSIALDVTESFAKKTWNLTVKTGSGRTGALSLPMPVNLRRLMVDTDGVDNGLGVSLYKEFSVNGTVGRATGIFASANRNTKYSLVLQGRGNGCHDSSDFTRWRLELNGPRADYAFFGNLK